MLPTLLSLIRHLPECSPSDDRTRLSHPSLLPSLLIRQSLNMATFFKTGLEEKKKKGEDAAERRSNDNNDRIRTVIVVDIVVGGRQVMTGSVSGPPRRPLTT